MKKVLTFIFMFLSLFLFTSCDKEKAVIVFSGEPFSQKATYSPANTFKIGDKIYWAVYNPKEFKTKLLRLQVFKKDSKSEFWGYEYLYNRTIELTNKKAYTDYTVINNEGYYVFQIFDYTDFQQPIALGIIKIE